MRGTLCISGQAAVVYKKKKQVNKSLDRVGARGTSVYGILIIQRVRWWGGEDCEQAGGRGRCRFQLAQDSATVSHISSSLLERGLKNKTSPGEKNY